jgi:hypothetical protein
MSTNLILNVGVIALQAVPLAFIKKPTSPEKQTSIAIGVGSGGSVPHIAFWGEDGGRISQYKGTWTIVENEYMQTSKPARPACSIHIPQY